MAGNIKVLVITGIRSEYDVLYPVMDSLRNDKKFELKVVVCGVHLSPWHGFTLEKIEEDGFVIADKIDTLLNTNRKTQRAKGVGMLTSALVQTIERENPDFILVTGDREEAIAAALVGNYMDVLVAHIGGGDPVYGNADDPIRFAVSKLAHIHFATARAYADNLLKIGEEEFRIFCTGNPALDNIKSIPTISVEEICNYLNFDIINKRYIVLIKHPLSSEKEQTLSQMRVTLESMKEFCEEKNIKVIGIYPNTDPGSFDILRAIEEFKDFPDIRFYKTLPRHMFCNLMRNALALAGNSSMGILEAPFYRLPVVNIGNRQKGRLNAGNVEFVDYRKPDIKKALEKACFNESYRSFVRDIENPFGDGYAAERIKKTLLSIDTREKKYYVKRKLC